MIKRLHLYYDMKLVTFGIDKKRNLIIQFLIFVQPCTQQPLILYQIERVPVPIVDKNTKALLLYRNTGKETIYSLILGNIYKYTSAGINH